MLGLNPMEQEIIDLTNNIVRNGYIYFPGKSRFNSPLSKALNDNRHDNDTPKGQHIAYPFRQIYFTILVFIFKLPEISQINLNI